MSVWVNMNLRNILWKVWNVLPVVYMNYYDHFWLLLHLNNISWHQPPSSCHSTWRLWASLNRIYAVGNSMYVTPCQLLARTRKRGDVSGYWKLWVDNGDCLLLKMVIMVMIFNSTLKICLLFNLTIGYKLQLYFASSNTCSKYIQWNRFDKRPPPAERE